MAPVTFVQAALITDVLASHGHYFNRRQDERGNFFLVFDGHVTSIPLEDLSDRYPKLLFRRDNHQNFLDWR